MEPQEFDLKQKISRDTMSPVVNRGVFMVFGCDFLQISWEISIYNRTHCISKNLPYQVKLLRFHTKLTILDFMNTLFFSKNKFGQIWEKWIWRWGNISRKKLFSDFFYFEFTESTFNFLDSNFPKCFLKFIHGFIGAEVSVRIFWHCLDFLTALGVGIIVC